MNAARPSFLRQWPLTTAVGVGGAATLAYLLFTPGTATERAPEIAEEPPALAAAPDAEAKEEALPPPAEPAAADPGKTGLYAMKAAPPADAAPPAALTSPYGGAFAVGSDDADVWGGLAGGEVGEAYGAGGLGLVGTGRGGGGTGEGTIGLGTMGLVGKGGGGGAGSGYGRGPGGSKDKKSAAPRARYEDGDGARADGRYEAAIQSRVLTVGTVDDNADPAGYKRALDKLASARHALGIEESAWDWGPHAPRHDPRPGALDVALVIDTTGSMGDELEYLKVEIRDIAQEIAQEFPNVEQRWGLILYRDHGDEYVVRKYKFGDIDAFVEALGQQRAAGGGDYPEAMDEALEASVGMGWRIGDAAARMVFLVADAPSHNGEGAGRFAAAVNQHRAARTAIYGVAASGVSDAAEAQLRLASKATGGQYIFLTDHSGVGGHHEAPKVEQYKVETLHEAMTRMIRGELGGDGARPLAKPPQAEPVVPIAAAPPEPAPAPALPVLAAPAEAPASASILAWILERVQAHLLFAASMSILLLAAIGADSLLRRRRA